MNADEALQLIEQDVDSAPQEAVLWALSRAQLARGLVLALAGKRREAKRILDAEAETGLLCELGRKIHETFPKGSRITL